VCVCVFVIQDGRNAEITAIRSGYGDVVEIVTRVNSVSTRKNWTILKVCNLSI